MRLPWKDSPPAFNSIRTPTSPAFTLLGKQPTSVERPNTVSDFAFSFRNNTDDFTKLPEDFGVKLNLYRILMKQPNLTEDAKPATSLCSPSGHPNAEPGELISNGDFTEYAKELLEDNEYLVALRNRILGDRGTSILRSTTISVGTAQVGTEAEPITAFSIGARTQILGIPKLFDISTKFKPKKNFKP